jgi:hypothetical protein
VIVGHVLAARTTRSDYPAAHPAALTCFPQSLVCAAVFPAHQQLASLLSSNRVSNSRRRRRTRQALPTMKSTSRNLPPPPLACASPLSSVFSIHSPDTSHQSITADRQRPIGHRSCRPRSPRSRSSGGDARYASVLHEYVRKEYVSPNL